MRRLYGGDWWLEGGECRAGVGAALESRGIVSDAIPTRPPRARRCSGGEIATIVQFGYLFIFNCFLMSTAPKK